MLSQQPERDFMESRINMIVGAILVVVCVYFIGFWYLQSVRGPYYEALAGENIYKDHRLPAPRGLIVDRNNMILSENRLSHNLFLTPGISKNLNNTLTFLSNVLGTDIPELVRVIQKDGTLRSLRPLLIYQDLSLPQVAYLSARLIEYPEIDIRHEQKRSYKFDHLFSHVIGYVGEITEDQEKINEFPGAVRRDIVGQSGLERYYNTELMGVAGYERKVVNSYGAELKEFGIPPKEPVPGKVLRLGMDYTLQQATEQAYADQNDYGAAVALDVRTGEVLMMFSKPYFNPNDFVPKIAPAKWKELLTDSQHPLQNRVIQNKFSPGSTFKIVMTLAALQEKKITPSTRFGCGGAQYIYNRVFRCWKPGGHGTVDLYRAIMQSCDVYFYNVGMRLDIDVIARYARKFGLGSFSEIDLPNEARGLVPDREWKKKATNDKWYPGETISVAIGQGPILVTALQQASLVAAVASGGTKIQPHLVSAKLSSDGKVLELYHPKQHQVTGIDPEYYEFVKRALWGVVNDQGTGGRARLDGYDVCGKTGTVQVVGYDRGAHLVKNAKEKYGDHAWFVSFAPYQDPKIAVAVFVEHGGHGSESAAPIAKKIYEAYFRKNKISPYPPPEFDHRPKSIRKPVGEGEQSAEPQGEVSGD